jgi:methylenetetrahydrofolate--tRNA-(uracil-5-)-methyltransferase
MKLTVIGAGLAGTEAAWQAAERGVDVSLFEMRPKKMTGAHRTGDLAELVCSNSLGSNLPNRAAGLLKQELRRLNSLLIDCADASSLPAGGALAVDREVFSAWVQQRISQNPKITLIREEVTHLPEDQPVIIATGPLTSPDFSGLIQEMTGTEHLYFFDAIAPIVHVDTINMDIAFRANRYGEPGENGDYLNCPFSKEQYDDFRNALLAAQRIPLRSFEALLEDGVVAGKGHFFQGCQPVEVIASRGEKALAFGPMRPTGLTDPRTGRWPFAVVQLRQDNLSGELYNLVGFQTNLTFSEQARVFRMIPGLEDATFERFGQMHRNTFIASPKLLNERLAFQQNPRIYFAGQLAGIEGYAGNIASGLIAGINAAYDLLKKPPFVLPKRTMIGALIHYITHAEIDEFQPTKAMFGLLPPPDDQVRRSKRVRYDYYAARAEAALSEYLHEVEFS